MPSRFSNVVLPSDDQAAKVMMQPRRKPFPLANAWDGATDDATRDGDADWFSDAIRM
jgi:hypothetical protein